MKKEMPEDKPKQIKSYIYPDVYSEITETDEFKEHGLSYAVNFYLAQALGLPSPPTPVEKKSAGGKRLGVKKNHHDVEFPANWFALLEGLRHEETFFQMDQPQISRMLVRIGLVEFRKKRGAVPTKLLLRYLSGKNVEQELKTFIESKVTELGYGVSFLEK